MGYWEGKRGEQEERRGIWCGGGRGRPQADPVAYEIRKASLLLDCEDAAMW